MYISGIFKTKDKGYDTFIEVIITNGDKSNIITIEDDSKDVLFAENPCVIETDNENLFQTIIKKTCTINLLTKINLFDILYANNARDITVIVRRQRLINQPINPGDEILFYGYLEPNVYSQPYANYYDELSLTAYDYLSTLQYYYYKNANNNYSYYKERANIRNFNEYLFEILNMNLVRIDGIDDDIKSHIYYDNSLKPKKDAANFIPIFEFTGVSDITFLGSDESDLWTNEEVLSEILQYFNLHIIQVGINFYIFNYNSLKNYAVIFTDLETKMQILMGNTYVNLITESAYADDGTNVSVTEVYNQLQIKCNIEGVENLIESPLDSDSLRSFYANKQRYCREYRVVYKANSREAVTYFYYLIKNKISVYDGASIIDWYMQAKYNPNWKFWYNGRDLSTDPNYHRTLNGVYAYQTGIANILYGNSLYNIAANIMSLGSVEINIDGSDDSVVNTVDMKDYIVISIRGNGDDTEENSDPSEMKLQRNVPIISYESNGSGSLYSPTDDTTTNYIVFSGNLFLQSYFAGYQSFDTTELHDDFYGMKTAPIDDVNVFVSTFQNRFIKYKDGNRYYYCYFPAYQQSDDVNSYGYYNRSLPPPSDDFPQDLEYQRSLYVTDKISKLGILECQLQIGDKYLCETYDENGNSVYVWRTESNLPVYDGYKINTFTIGINPKINDFIIGQKYELANNITIDMNLGDTKGMAIPVKKSDNLSGAVNFKILGPINTTWEEKVMTRHRTWFRRAKYSNVAKSVLSHTQAIFIENFKVKIVSDNDGYNVDTDNDLIYLSDENNKYIQKKDDIEFNIYTALTSEEAYNLGVKSGINSNTVLYTNASSGENRALDSVYCEATDEEGKPEELYIDALYKEYSSPKLLVQTTLHNHVAPHFFGCYTFNYMKGKLFVVQSMTEDLKNATSEITFKEISKT